MSKKLSTEQEMQTSIQSELFDRLPDEKFAKPQFQSNLDPSIDVAKAMGKALANPLYYPPLSESVFPGDAIAIGLQADVPQPDVVLAALLEHLSSLSIEPADIIVVVTPRTADRLGIEKEVYFNPDANQSEGKPPGIFPVTFGFHSFNLQVHDPENETGLSYLVANAEGEPIHINRTLVDADVILPIGSPTAGDVNQQADSIFPQFSNETSKARFATGEGSFVSRWHDIQLANDTLGSFFTIQIVCGPGDNIRQIICGARKDATDQARISTNELWAFHWPQDASLTVGTMESDAEYQTWDDFANALIAASRVTTLEGPIVIWSEIGVPPDPKIRQACFSQFDDSQDNKMTDTMKQISDILSEHPVFLRSRLKQNAIEELGIGFVQSSDEVMRIAEPHSDCLLIRDAHKCQIGIRSGADRNPS